MYQTAADTISDQNRAAAYISVVFYSLLVHTFFCVHTHTHHTQITMEAIKTDSRYRKTSGLGKGKGKMSMRRQRPQGISYIPGYAIRKLARRGGVKRIGHGFVEENCKFSEGLLDKIVRDALLYMEHAKRQTLRPTDIQYSIKRHGFELYI